MLVWALVSTVICHAASESINLTSRASPSDCKYPSSLVGGIKGYCHHIYQGGAGFGISEKNCGDAMGDISFVFPRGFNSYYKYGIISTINFAVKSWGKYLRCNYPSSKNGCSTWGCIDSSDYDCKGGGQTTAGREKVTWNAGGWWYSFPRKGLDKDWSEYDWPRWSRRRAQMDLGPSPSCAEISIEAKCLFNNMAKAMRCPKGCEGLSSDKCADCFAGMSVADEKRHWDEAIWGGKCRDCGKREGGQECYPTLEATAQEESEDVPTWDRNVTWGFWRRPTFWNSTLTERSTAVVV